MYKILISVRKDTVNPLFTVYKTEQEIIITPAITDEVSGEIITPAVKEIKLLDWSCKILSDLEIKIDELLDVYTIIDIIPFKVVEIDAVIKATDGDLIGN